MLALKLFEALKEKPYYKKAFQKQRCLIPTSGFYEWTSDPYNSASEVVRDALRLLIEKETLFKQQVDKLNQDIALGLTQLAEGKGIEGKKGFDEIKAHYINISHLYISKLRSFFKYNPLYKINFFFTNCRASFARA